MWPNPLETSDLVTFTEEILNGKLRFFVSGAYTEFINVSASRTLEDTEIHSAWILNVAWIYARNWPYIL